VWAIYTQPGLFVSAIYLDAAIVTMALAGFQGWLGGELVYSYGVFVKRAGPTEGANEEADPKDGKGNHHHGAIAHLQLYLRPPATKDSMQS